MKTTRSAISVVGLIFITGCATAPLDGSRNQSNDQQDSQTDNGSPEQSAVIGAVGGALAGCALAALLGQKCADGAKIGAFIGAAIGWSSHSEKVASAQTVNAQAQREGIAVPEREIRLRDYHVHASSTVAQGGGRPLQVVGEITLVGQAQRVPEVIQSMTLIKSNGERASDKPQIAKVERVDGAGQYKAIGVYKIPRGMEQGRYTVQCLLYLDGKEVARRDTAFQVARVGGRETVLALAAAR
jgi:hypothetical protein